MAKGRLEFDLPQEQSEYMQAVHGGDWKSIVFEVSLFLRNKLKHGHQFKDADEALEAVRDHLWEECKSYGLDPWEG